MIEYGTLVWFNKNEHESELRHVGEVIPSQLFGETEKEFRGMYYIAYQSDWYIRFYDKITPLTDNEKVLYMLETGKQCK